MGTSSINNPSPPDSRDSPESATASVDNPPPPDSESATNPQLPQDLITEILLYLPMKSLARFKCVSKPWLSLISSPEFTESRFATALRDAQLVFFDTNPPNSRLKHCSLSDALHNFSTDVSDFECPSPCLPGYHEIVGIVNGLVCLSGARHDLYIYNPILRQSKHLPSSTSSMLGPDSVRPSITYGFGYDELNDDYKVVEVMRFHDRNRVERSEIKVYSLKSDSWRRIEGFEGGNAFGKGTYANGKIFWANRRAYWSEIIDDELWKIASLDLASYKFEKVKGPCYETLFSEWEIASFGGSLYMLYCRVDRSAEVWVMDVNEVENSWSKVFFLDYDDCVHDPRPPYYSLKKVVGILGDGDILLEDSLGLIVYRTKTKDFKNIQLDGNLYRQYFVYVKSLVAL